MDIDAGAESNGALNGRWRSSGGGRVESKKRKLIGVADWRT